MKHGRRGFKLATVLVSLVAIATFDLALRLIGVVPPDDPILFHVRTYVQDFSPFVESGNSSLTIRPDWVKKDETYQITRGHRVGRLFLHPGFHPVQFTRRKAPGTIRIFALGGSTTFGQWVGEERAFAGLLRQRLAELASGWPIQVINLGCPGLESTRVAILHRAVLDLDPDLVLVYSGHNEMLLGEELTTPAGGPIQSARAGLLRVSTLAAWLNHLVTGYRESRDVALVSEEAAALRAGQILSHVDLPDEHERYRLKSVEYRKRVAARYAENIRAMADAGDAAGVPTLFVLPSPNLQFPPKISAHVEGFTETAAFDAALAGAQRASEAGRWSEALEAAGRAVELSPEHAMARYSRGMALVNLGRSEEALAELKRAVDLEVHTHRITPLLQSAMIEAAEQAGAPWVDLRPIFETDLTPDSARELFVDHCHPTEYGHRQIAELLLPVVAEAAGIHGSSGK